MKESSQRNASTDVGSLLWPSAAPRGEEGAIDHRSGDRSRIRHQESSIEDSRARGMQRIRKILDKALAVLSEDDLLETLPDARHGDRPDSCGGRSKKSSQ
eukprot:CAMPEP_0176002588 /NCGR_PEP_ID=MMETSP0120_2-20121206/724_1 /TAXON_ID=160619 /ORGANISM="Kryptoperidinium foliaceum, Strain CCMP 1326" /LENGTH=99 /DNA_ID=CAMNT_0017335181 /DNA_START=1441 /DNA_END=1740 /DNA_ORIENTATION=-